MVCMVSNAQMLAQELEQLREEFRKAEQQGKAFRDPGVRKYLERKILEIDAELHGQLCLHNGTPFMVPHKG